MMRFGLTAAVAAASLSLAAPALAHHSFSAFDRSRKLEITGAVKAWEWTNPHSWLQITVTPPGGTPTDYSFEGYSPLMLPRFGITRNKFKPGDRVTVSYFPRKDNTNGGQFVGVEAAPALAVGAGK